MNPDEETRQIVASMHRVRAELKQLIGGRYREAVDEMIDEAEAIAHLRGVPPQKVLIAAILGADQAGPRALMIAALCDLADRIAERQIEEENA